MARTMISLLMVGVLVVGLAIPVCAAYPVLDSGIQAFLLDRSSEASALAVAAAASGTSSGYTYNSGILLADEQSVFEEVSVSFGTQAAGDYIINIYHWGSDYTANFMLTYGDRHLPSLTSGGTTTLLVSHSGGTLSLGGSFNITHDVSFELTGGRFIDGSGSLEISWPSSWTFNIEDIVVIPLVSAPYESYGIFGPLAALLNQQHISLQDYFTLQFSDLKSNLLTRFTNLQTHITNHMANLQTYLSTKFANLQTHISDKINDLKMHQTNLFGNLQTYLTVKFDNVQTHMTNLNENLKAFFTDLFNADEDGAFEEGTAEAKDQLEQVQELEDQIFGGFEDAATAVDPSSVTISNDVLSGFSFLGDISMMVFNGLGGYQVLVIIPLMIGIASIVSGRGFTSAMARYSRTKKGR